MNKTAQEIIMDYYTAIQNAFKTGNLDCAKLHFAQHASIIGPNERFDGKAAIEDMLKNLLVPVVSHFIIKRQYFDTDSGCTILDCVVKKSGKVLPVVEWVLVKNGQISEFYLFYDSAQWAQALD